MSEVCGDAFGEEEVQSANAGHSNDQPELVYSGAVEFFAELLAAFRS
jgi:hypothetical protein